MSQAVIAPIRNEAIIDPVWGCFICTVSTAKDTHFGLYVPGNNTIVKAAKIVLAYACFAEEFAGKAQVDGAGFVQLLEVFGGEGQIDSF